MPAGKHKPGYKQPKVGERRRVRKPLTLDRLPPETKQKILELRTAGRTWEQVAAELKLSPKALRNWYDLRIEQATEDIEQRRRATDRLVEKWGAGPLQHLDQASLNRLAAEVFEGELLAQTNPELYLRALDSLIRATGRNRQLDQESERLKLEREKLGRLQAAGKKLVGELKAGKVKGGSKDIAERIERELGL